MPMNDLKAWDPTKRRNSDRFGPPAQVGDVGYITNGTFIRLFNATEDAHAEINQAHGVPSNRYVNQTIRNVGEEVTGQILNTGLTATFECTSEQGALLFLRDAAHQQQLQSGRRLKQYIKDNINDWYAFATSDEVDAPVRRLDDIVFVYGCIRTTRWAVASFIEGGVSAKFS
ncbi:hypothetical protein C8Q72DRAFT_881570 [Fomitopsis betulina]|nr:hypothetical protein C8Q72DRAFT_881570 [Fomitopsis betulina]